MKRFKNHLDERQEQELLKIEHNGAWGAFIGLLAAIFIQGIMGAPFSQIAGEWIVFMAVCIYMVIACARHGIWDRYLQPKASHNLLASMVGGVIVFAFNTAVIWRYWDGAFEPSLLLIPLMSGFFVFVLCFVLTSLTSAYVKKRAKKLEADAEDEDA